MIVYENEYRRFLATVRKLQDNTIDSFVVRLESVSQKIGKPISPQLFNGDFTPNGFHNAWNLIAPTVAPHFQHPRTLGDCKSNFKRYWEMLCANEKLR